MSGENINCNNCQNDFETSEVVELKCKHTFCLACFETYLKDNLNYQIICPHDNCQDLISDNQIRKILDTDSIELYELKCWNHLENIHCCLLPGCNRQIAFEDSNIQYECERCTLFNCIKCRAAHASVTCSQYISMLPSAGEKLCEKELNRAKKIFAGKKAKASRLSLDKASKTTLNPNQNTFECTLCSKLIQKGFGVVLKNCLDDICKDCLKGHVKSGLINCTSCPICSVKLDDSDCRGLLTEDEMQKYEEFMIRNALPKFERAARCHFPDCPNVVDISGNLTKWKCEMCKNTNCLVCNAIHHDESCATYQNMQKEFQKYIDDQIRNKCMMKCPECNLILEKSGGCDKIKCNGCNTNLCWKCQAYISAPGTNSKDRKGAGPIVLCNCKGH